MKGPTEKKSADRLRRSWKDPFKSKDDSGKPGRNSPSSDTLLVIGLVLSMVGTFLTVKICPWIGGYIFLVCAANYQGSDDFRQALSGIMMTILSLSMLYSKDPSPMF